MSAMMSRLRAVSLVLAAVAGSWLLAVTVHAQGPGDVLTDEGYEALTWCESDHDPEAVNGRYFGEEQWDVQYTWPTAARGAGFEAWAGTDPRWVPRDVRRDVTKDWWSKTVRGSQWPECFDDAVRAMGGHAECDHLRNVILPCPVSVSVEDRTNAPGGGQLPAPVPEFAG